MLRIRTHRLELARHRIERDLKRLAIEHSREPRSGTFKPNLELKATAQLDPAVRKPLLVRYRGETR
jgi:hypothetical protein